MGIQSILLISYIILMGAGTVLLTVGIIFVILTATVLGVYYGTRSSTAPSTTIIGQISSSFSSSSSTAPSTTIIPTTTECTSIVGKCTSQISSISDPVLGGADVVEMWNGNVAQGSSSNEVKYNGYTFQFSSSANASTFEGDPGKYAPKAAGFCGWAMTGYDTAMCTTVDGDCDPPLIQMKSGKCQDCSGCPSGMPAISSSEDIPEACIGAGGGCVSVFGKFTDLAGKEGLWVFLGEGAKNLFSSTNNIPSEYTDCAGVTYSTAGKDPSAYFATVAQDNFSRIEAGDGVCFNVNSLMCQ
jgi:YHS domain-containing protein